VATWVGVGVPSDADDSEPDPSEESEHDVRAANTTAATTAVDDVLHIALAMEIHLNWDPSPLRPTGDNNT
jgi:hypothetical protein